MNYPFWDVGVGYGVLMGVIAVVHVFVSHFAIGGGLYLVVAERAARRASDTARLEFLERLSKFFVLVTVVFGALTGVGDLVHHRPAQPGGHRGADPQFRLGLGDRVDLLRRRDRRGASSTTTAGSA